MYHCWLKHNDRYSQTALTKYIVARAVCFLIFAPDDPRTTTLLKTKLDFLYPRRLVEVNFQCILLLAMKNKLLRTARAA
jgi:hypothetical protein